MQAKRSNLAYTLIIAQITLVFSLFIGCSLKKTKEFEPIPPKIGAEQIWSKFLDKQRFKRRNKKGFRIKGSIDISTPKQDSRMTYLFWGNYLYPLRIDLKAGLGTTYALWRITDNEYKAYFPSQETVYTHSDPVLGTVKLGFPLPFSFQKLAFILNGHWREIVPCKYSRTEYKKKLKCWKFIFNSRQGGIYSLKLDKNAYPIEITGKSPYPWKVALKNYFRQEKKAIPQKIILTINNNYKTSLRIKDIQSREKTWPTHSLKLKLPKDTAIVPLKERYMPGPLNKN